MNCNYAQEQMLLVFGNEDSEPLPKELSDHLMNCPKCQQFMADNMAFAESFQAGSYFDLNPEVLGEMTLAIENGIDKIESRQSWWQSVTEQWYEAFQLRRVLPLAASLALVFTLGMLTNNITDVVVPDNFAISFETSDPLDLYSEFILDEPDESTVEVLLWNLNENQQGAASALLEDDISEEEFDYLMTNIDVGELL